MEKTLRIQTKFLVLAGVFAAVTGILAQISVPLPSGVPVTMQTFAVALAAFVLGAKLGTASIGIYILLGAVGVPVFSGLSGGAAVLLGMTGGFIWGFVPMAFFCGLASDIKHPAAAAGLSAAGLALCHLPGIVQFQALSGMGFAEAFLLVSAPYLVKDIVSVVLARMAARALRRGMYAADLLPRRKTA